MSVVLEIRDKRIGRVLTPEALVRALCRWAIRSSDDLVLDLGVGEGAFALTAFERLRALGAEGASAAVRIYGAEFDTEVFERAQEIARRRLGRRLPNVVRADFHDLQLPSVEAVIGNPPYIRRHYQDDPIKLRSAAGSRNATGLTDAYCYFLLRACSALRPGGRLAVIVSASWLDMKYGRDLKQLLVDQFRLHLLLAFEGRVFSNALVKPVVILAEKTPQDGPVSFACLNFEAPLDSLEHSLEDLAAGRPTPTATVTRVAQSDLSPAFSWTAFLKAPDVYADIGKAAPLTPLKDVAESRIGLQTFAKPFYILTRAEADGWGIEPEYRIPLVFSPREVKKPVISDLGQVRHVVFACDRPETSLRGTAAWRYIAKGMQTLVRVRGNDETVRGFHQAPRVARARRRPWYNLLSDIQRRGTYPILLPRRTFESYLVSNNQAGAVANEDFIELRPLAGADESAPLLAFLNSSIGEFLVRSHSFQYGGGVFNLNPGAVRDIPVVDPAELSTAQRARLAGAWSMFVKSYGTAGARQDLSRRVADIVGVSPELHRRVEDSLALLVRLARAANEKH